MSRMAGRTLGQYEVLREIAQGGMGTLLLARQTSLGRAAVLKKVRRDLTERPELQKRFEREARSAATIHHHNVVAVYDYFMHRNDRYIAQEFVDGTDLAAVLARKTTLPWRVACLIALETLRGLEEIHSVGTVHRDLKPSNILLGRRGEVKITDFGIALEATGSALTTPGTVVGTPVYMPPEQMIGERMDGRGDLFSWGVVVYEMLAGCPPYPDPKEDDALSLLQKKQKERYPPVRSAADRVPHFLARLVRRCLRGKARRRPSTAQELRRTLERRLGNPSPADCRTALAGWLWDAQVFRARKNETVVRLSSSLPSDRNQVWRWAVVAAAGIVVIATLLVYFLPPAHLRYVPAAIVGPVKSAPVPAPADLLPRFGEEVGAFGIGSPSASGDPEAESPEPASPETRASEEPAEDSSAGPAATEGG